MIQSQSFRPSRPYLELVKALFTKTWDAQSSRLSETTEQYAAKARQIETEIGKVVDRMVEVTNTRALRAFEDRIEALEREKLIALEKASRKPASTRPFEEMFEHSLRFLVNPYECGKIGGSNARSLVVRLAFAEPLFYVRETGCLNTKKPNVFNILEGKNVLKKEMVPPE